MWTLSYAPPTLTEGERYPVIASFPSYEGVVTAIGLIEQYDLPSVFEGHYEIAGDETVKCYVCAQDMKPSIYGEACDYCMSGAEYDDYREVNPYDQPGAWMDSTFPNEY